MKKSVQEYFLVMVETYIKKNPKATLPDGYAASVETWNQMHDFKPPYSSFDAFRKFREKRAKRKTSDF